MATFYKTQKMITAVVFFLFIFSSNTLSSARLLKPNLNLGLPVVVVVDDGFDKPDQHPKPQALPCDHHHHMLPIKRPHVGILRSPTQRLARNYGPMILGKLPKGKVTPSGPSGGTNDTKN